MILSGAARTQTPKSAAQMFAISKLHGVLISRQRESVATIRAFPNKPATIIKEKKSVPRITYS